MASAISAGSIDVNALVKQLMIVERQPLTALTTKEASYQSKLSALGLLKSNVSNFQAALQGLSSSSSSSFLAFKATSSDATIFSASANSTAVAGTYSLEISKLAKAQNLAATGQVSQAAAIGVGTITFDFGTITGGTLNTSGKYDLPGGALATSFDSNGTGPKNVVIDGTNNTLEGIRDAINAAKIGVTASIINDGSATPYRLVLSSDSTGKSNSIKISVAGDAALANLLDHDPTTATQNLSETTTAQNAEFKLNGVAISKTSNTVTDAIQGVSLTLNKETVTPATLTVARDTAGVSDKVASFVKAYNELYSALKNSSAYKSKSALEGDSTIRSFMTDLRGIASAAVGGGTIANFYEVGITFTSTGTMQLDSAKLSSAMSTDFNDVANLFNSATGYATQFDQWATNALTVGGTFDSKTSSINQAITSIGTRKEALERQMTLIEQRYTQQFSSLNVLLGKMNQTSAYIAQQLTKLE